MAGMPGTFLDTEERWQQKPRARIEQASCISVRPRSSSSPKSFSWMLHEFGAECLTLLKGVTLD
jgi:hypothetical protein